MGDWRTVELEDLAAPINHALSTGPFGSAISSQFFQTSGVPVIRGTNLSVEVGTRLNEREYVFIDEEKAKSFSRSVVQSGDLIFTCWGTVGQVGIIPSDPMYPKYVISNKQMKLTPDSSKIDPLYLYYYFSSPAAQQHLQSIAIGSSIPGFNLGQLRKFPVTLPSLVDQGATVRILTALDGKIEHNSRVLSKILDLGDALYRCSVSAESVMRPIDSIAVFHNKRRMPLSASERAEIAGNIPYYGATGVLDYVNRPIFNEVLVLVGEDGSVIDDTERPITQYIWGPAWINNHAHPLSGKNISTELLYFILRASKITHLVTGAVQPKISMTNLKSHSVPVPIGGTIRYLQAQLAHLMTMYRSLKEENQDLVILRNTLLPKLMDGTLTVRTAENLVSNVV